MGRIILYLPALDFFPLTFDFESFSAASLLVLYSMRFCSKFGSSKYSCSAPANETGA